MNRPLQITVSAALFAQLQRRAREIGSGTKAEDVAADWLEQRSRESRDLHIRFQDAAKLVDQRARTRGLGRDDCE